MLCIKDQMDSIYYEIDMVITYTNVKVDYFYSQVDTASMNFPNVLDIA